MMVPTPLRTLVVALALGSVLALPGPGRAQQPTGRIVGRVVEQGTGRAIAGAQVFVAGTRLGNLTTAEGAYDITAVPVGQQNVQVQMLGYGEEKQTVTVRAGQSARADFQVHQVAIALDEMVVTGAGVATQKRMLGNTVATVDAAKLMQTSAVQDVSSLLQARIPGVIGGATGGLAGEGMRIEIRGNASLTQYNQPVVYVDGVRVDNGGGWGPGVSAGGGGDPSRLSDINPDDIARVEVLKGAAAATLYGTEASSGVIQIFTKHGAPGATHWTFQVQEGVSGYPQNAYAPHAGFAMAEAPTTTGPHVDAGAAFLSQYWGQNIQPFQVFSVNLVPMLYQTGHDQTYAASVEGGNARLTYHAAGRVNLDDGPFGAKQWAVPGYREAQNTDNHKQGDISLTLIPTDKLRLRVTGQYSEGYHEVPQADNNIYGAMSVVINSKPENASCGPSATTISFQACNSVLGGNPTGSRAFLTAREAMQRLTYQNAQTFSGTVNGNWQILPSVTADVTAGLEHVATQAVEFLPFRWNVDGFSASNVLGDRTVSNVLDHRVTLDGHISWDRTFSDFSSSFVLGSQVYETQTNAGYEDGNAFPGPGVEVAGAGALQTVYEAFIKEVQLGIFGQEQIGFKNFAFLTVGARFDKHSAFGQNAPSVTYPKASLSIVPSSLSGWHSGLLSTFRLRAAVGESGRQPGAFDKFTTFAPQAAPTGPGLIPANLGDPSLKPEISTEWEGGTELGLLHDRASVNVTYWHRVVNDLLYPRQYAPSGGFVQAQLSNIGQMKAHGVELEANGNVLSRRNVALNLYANGAFLREIVTSLGGAPAIKVGGSYPRPRNFIMQGYAPGAFFGAAIRPTPAGTYPIDVNNSCNPATADQLLQYFSVPRSPDEIQVLVKNGDPRPACGGGNFLLNYLGKPTPDWSGSFGGTVTLLRNVQVNANFEYRAGNFFEQDLTDAFRRSNPLIGRNTVKAAQTEAILLNPASTPQQRMDAGIYWAEHLKALSPLDGLNEVHRADFIRFRELDLTYNVPAQLVSRYVHASTASITFSGRNIGLWTRFPSSDPEMAEQGLRSGGLTSDGAPTTANPLDANFRTGITAWGFPIPHEYTMSVRIGF